MGSLVELNCHPHKARVWLVPLNPVPSGLVFPEMIRASLLSCCGHRRGSWYSVGGLAPWVFLL